jgi:hypothetical protein
MSALQDYEIEIKDRENIFIKLWKRFKEKKSQLLLGPGADERKNSSDLLWRVGGYKSNIFDKFDSLHNKNVIGNRLDSVIFEVVGENKIKNEVEFANKKVSKLIIPRNIETRKSKT